MLKLVLMFKHNLHLLISQDLQMQMDKPLILLFSLRHKQKHKLKWRHKLVLEQLQKQVLVPLLTPQLLLVLLLQLVQLQLIHLLVEVLNILQNKNLMKVSQLTCLKMEMGKLVKLDKPLKFNILVHLQQMEKYSIHPFLLETLLLLLLEK